MLKPNSIKVHSNTRPHYRNENRMAVWVILEIFGTSVSLKGQMNQKIEIFSFVALPSPNTKKNHPK